MIFTFRFYRNFLIVYFLCIGNLFSQNLYDKINCSGYASANEGEYTYSAILSAKSYAPGMRDVRYQLSISNFEITSFFYKGINASTIDGVNFPIQISNVSADVKFELQYYIGNTTYKTGKLSMLSVKDGAGDYGDLSSVSVSSLVRTFNIKTKDDFDKLSLKVVSCDMSVGYFDELNRIKTLINEKIRIDERIEELNKKLFNLSNNNKSDLLKKKSIYEQLSKIDKNKDYSIKKESVERDLNLLAVKQFEKEIANRKNKNNKEKEKSKLNERSNAMIIQDLINSYPEIKRRMKHYKSIGDWENYNKEKKVADYIRDNLLSKKESKRQLERDLAENVSDIINTINIREADFINNRLLLDYTFNDFNEVDFGYSHRSVWGKFFWQVDFLINAVYFKGYRLKEESTQSLFNDKENNDIYWTNYERDAVNNRSVNRLYGNENIFSIGGGMSSGFGVIFPFKKRQNNIVISATGNARIRTESLVSYGYQCGIEYHLENIGFGLYYKNSTFKTLDNDDIILSNKNPKFGRVNTSTSTRNSEGELVNEEIVYYRARNPNDFDNIVNFSSFEFSIFILLFN